MNSIVIGRRGLGKSTLAEWLARQENDSIIVFDPNDQFKDAPLRTSDLEELKSWLENQDDEEGFYISFIPGNEEVEDSWNRFAPVIWEYGDYALIIDEAHWLMKPNYINPWLSRFIRQAPRRERGDEDPIDIILTAHKPQDINGVVLSQADYEYLFRQTKQRDLEYIAKEFDFDSGPLLCESCSRCMFVEDEQKQKPAKLPVVEVVRSLKTPQSEEPGREVIKVPIEGPERYEIMRDPKEWHIDIKKVREPEFFA